MTNSSNKTMAGARFTASVKLSGLELPECFAQATVSSAAKATYKKNPRDLKRLATKVAKLPK